MRPILAFELSLMILIMSVPGLALAGLAFLVTGDLPVWLRMIVTLVIWVPLTIAVILKIAGNRTG